MSSEFDDEIIRYDRDPGDVANVVDLPEGSAVLYHGGVSVGDPVFLPAEIGGGMRRVAAIEVRKCPHDCEAVVKHYLMAGDDPLYCAECPVHKFTWYRMGAGRPEE